MSSNEVIGEEGAEAGSRYRTLPPFWRWLLAGVALVVVLMAVNQILNLKMFLDILLIDARYLYLTLGLLIPFVFILFPAHRGAARSIPWYDVVLFLALLGCFLFLAAVAEEAEAAAWEFTAPGYAIYVSVATWVLLLEAVRRAGGLALFLVILVFSTYPLFAGSMPAPLNGMTMPVFDTAAYHMFGSESLLGIPARTFASIVLGFILFGVALQYSGCGKFFMDFAFALLGHVRGGPAKVSIFASGLLGSLSGSVTTNVLTTGTLTIPAMKKLGFSPRFAAAVEACASTGAVLMPPIMGAVAFVMAAILNIPYIDVAIAALVPSLIYYIGLFIAIDAYSARRRLKGMAREDLPRIGQSIKEGWHYIFVFVFLIYMLAVAQQETLAPYYATALLIVINQMVKRTRWSWADFRTVAEASGRLFAELAAILGAIGLVVGAFTMTGMAATFTSDLILMAGDNAFVLLLAGAATCFVLGMGLPVTAAYIFLAIVLAPGLVSMGFDPLAVHLFLLYWGMLSFITPPVAVGAFAAAAVADTDGMATGFEAMRIGAIIYFIPFFFVFNPALILNGTPYEIVFVICTALAGVLLIASSLQGYLIGVGDLLGGPMAWLARALLCIGGFLFALPGGPLTGLTNVELLVAAVTVSGLGVGIGYANNQRLRARQAAPS